MKSHNLSSKALPQSYNMEENTAYSKIEQEPPAQHLDDDNVYELTDLTSGNTDKNLTEDNLITEVYDIVQPTNKEEDTITEPNLPPNAVQLQYKNKVKNEPSEKTVQIKKQCVVIVVVTVITILALVLTVVNVIYTISLSASIGNKQEIRLQTSNSKHEIQALQLEIQSLQELLNDTEHTFEEQVFILQDEQQTQDGNLTDVLMNIRRNLKEQQEKFQRIDPGMDLRFMGTFLNPAISSCKNLPQGSPSGDYWIIPSRSDAPVQVYCDMTRSCCGTSGGWTRVANLNMTDPSQECPDGFRFVTRTTTPLRTCGRPGPSGCVDTVYPVYGFYSQVCGRVIGYQYSTSNAFRSYLSIDGVTIHTSTNGVVTENIWSFVNALDETRSDEDSCPCTRPDIPYTGQVPSNIGQDYFCETGSRGLFERGKLYTQDPLWDGQGCGSNSTCCSFNNPPWFCKQLPQPTTDDIELRLCLDEDITNEDIQLEIVEIYVK